MLRGLLPILRGRQILKNAGPRGIARSGITTTTAQWSQRKMPDKPKPVPEDEFTEVFLKGSGPGGQKINKTSSAVQLKHIPTGIVLKVQAQRSRTQNRKIARQMLAEKLDVLAHGKESRSAVVGDKKRKKKSSATKKSKRKYRRLEEQKALGVAQSEAIEDGEELEADVSAGPR